MDSCKSVPDEITNVQPTSNFVEIMTLNVTHSVSLPVLNGISLPAGKIGLMKIGCKYIPG